MGRGDFAAVLAAESRADAALRRATAAAPSVPLDEISEDHTSCSLSTASSWDWDNRDGGDADVPAADDPPPWLDNSTSAGGVQAEAALAGGVPSPAVDLPPEPLLGAAAQDGEVQVPHDASAVPVVADVEAGEAHGGARADSGLPSSLPEERAPNGGAGSSSDWVNDLDPPRTNDHRWDAEQWGDWARWEATRPFTAGGSLPLPARDAQHGDGDARGLPSGTPTPEPRPGEGSPGLR